MVANSLPAINDITAPELRTVLSAAAAVCPIIRRARDAAARVGAGPILPAFRSCLLCWFMNKFTLGRPNIAPSSAAHATPLRGWVGQPRFGSFGLHRVSF
jgi:hypothetical protein